MKHHDGQESLFFLILIVRISHQCLQRSGVQLCPPSLVTKKTCLLVSCLPSKALLMLQQCNWKEHFSISVSELNRKYIRSFLELQLQGGTTHLTKHLDFLLAVGQVARDRIFHVVKAQTLTGQATQSLYMQYYRIYYISLHVFKTLITKNCCQLLAFSGHIATQKEKISCQ